MVWLGAATHCHYWVSEEKIIPHGPGKDQIQIIVSTQGISLLHHHKVKKKKVLSGTIVSLDHLYKETHVFSLKLEPKLSIFLI